MISMVALRTCQKINFISLKYSPIICPKDDVVGTRSRTYEKTHLKGERVGMLAEFFDQSLLKPRQALLLLRHGRKRLNVGHKEVLAKRQAKNIQVLASIAKGTRQCHKNCGSQTNSMAASVGPTHSLSIKSI